MLHLQNVTFELSQTRSIGQSITEMFISYFCSVLGLGPWRGSLGVALGPVHGWSADSVRSGGPRTGGQCFWVTRLQLKSF